MLADAQTTCLSRPLLVDEEETDAAGEVPRRDGGSGTVVAPSYAY